MLETARGLVDRLDPPYRLRQARAALRADRPSTVYYLATRAHLYTIRYHLDGWGTGLRDLVVPLSYDELFAQIAPPDWWETLHESAWGDEQVLRRLDFTPQPGVYLFTDVDRLELSATRRAALCWNLLARYGGRSVKLLNHPTRTMRRYELLRTLYERGLNPFNVYRLIEARWPARYPVFVRYASNHASPRPELLRSRAELERMIDVIDRRGIDRNDVLVEEYVETSDAQGRYRSYGAFRVGQQIFPQRLLCSADWAVKRADLRTDDIMQESTRYIIERERFPAEHVRQVFDLARVEFGRLDFAYYQGRPVVWEININPTITLPPGIGVPGGEERRQFFAQSLEAALRALVSG